MDTVTLSANYKIIDRSSICSALKEKTIHAVFTLYIFSRLHI